MRKGKLKSEVLLKLANRLMIAGLIVAISGIGLLIGSGIAMEVIADQNGYDVANNEHKTKQVVDAQSKLQKGEISQSQYDGIVRDPEDLGKDTYMNSDEDVPAEARESYATADKVYVSGIGADGVGAGLICAGILASRKASKRKDEEVQEMFYPSMEEREKIFHQISESCFKLTIDKRSRM